MDKNKITEWYNQALTLLQRSSWPVDWRDITKRHLTFTWESNPEGERRAWEDTQARAEEDETLLRDHAEAIAQEAQELAQVFDQQWIDYFYAKLDDIVIEELGEYAAAATAIVAYCWQALYYARDLIATNQQRRLNCLEWDSWGKRESWLSNSRNKLRKRLLKERSILIEKLENVAAVAPAKPTGAKGRQSRAWDKSKGGREKAYSDQELEDIKRAWDKFRKEYKEDKVLKGIRKGSLAHFVDWAERNDIDIPATDENEAKQMLDLYRKRFPKPKQRKKKSSQ